MAMCTKNGASKTMYDAAGSPTRVPRRSPVQYSLLDIPTASVRGRQVLDLLTLFALYPSTDRINWLNLIIFRSKYQRGILHRAKMSFTVTSGNKMKENAGRSLGRRVPFSPREIFMWDTSGGGRTRRPGSLVAYSRQAWQLWCRIEKLVNGDPAV